MVSIHAHLAAGKMRRDFDKETRKPGTFGKNSWFPGFLIFLSVAAGLRAADYDAQFNQWFEVQTNLQSWAGDFTQTRTLDRAEPAAGVGGQSMGQARRIPLGTWQARANHRAAHAGPTADRLSPAQARRKISARCRADRPDERRAGAARRQPAARPRHDGGTFPTALGGGDQRHPCK